MARAGGTPQVPGDGVCHGWSRRDAVVSMRVEDYFVQGRRGWVRLNEKGGKEHEMPAHYKGTPQ